MTILAVKNQLITHFLSNDTFEFSRHALEIEFDKDLIGFREEMIRAAMAELETLGLIKKLSNHEREIWVLAQPLNAFNQQVTIGPLVAEIIANTINFYNESENIEVQCDKTKIDEEDIMRLVSIVEGYEEFMNEAKNQADKQEQSGE